MKILIPLGNGSCWGNNNELRYMLRSIEQNLKGSYEIEIYGDAPEWLTNVTVVKTERYYPEWLKEENAKNKRGLDYENFFDTLNKVKMFYEVNEGDFLYMYDDVLVIKEISIEDIQNTPLEFEEPEFYHIRKHEKHGRTINTSVELLALKHRGGFYNYLLSNNIKFDVYDRILNYETHLPRKYNIKKLKLLIDYFNFTELKIPYALATLYFNYYPEDAGDSSFEPIKKIKAGFYGTDENVASYLSGSLQEIEAATKDKIFVNYNDMGLNCMATDLSGKQYLKEWIMKRFPNKSKFEK